MNYNGDQISKYGQIIIVEQEDQNIWRHNLWFWCEIKTMKLEMFNLENYGAFDSRPPADSFNLDLIIGQ